MKKCVVHLSQKNRIGINPFIVWDPGLFGIAALGIGIGNRKSNLKNLESGIENRALENRESESKIESGSETLLLVQERPCKPSRSTLLPQWHVCPTQMLAPRRKPIEIRSC